MYTCLVLNLCSEVLKGFSAYKFNEAHQRRLTHKHLYDLITFIALTCLVFKLLATDLSDSGFVN